MPVDLDLVNGILVIVISCFHMGNSQFHKRRDKLELGEGGISCHSLRWFWGAVWPWSCRKTHSTQGLQLLSLLSWRGCNLSWHILFQVHACYLKVQTVWSIANLLIYIPYQWPNWFTLCVFLIFKWFLWIIQSINFLRWGLPHFENMWMSAIAKVCGISKILFFCWQVWDSGSL